MKRILLTTTLALAIIFGAQSKEKVVKKGWNFGPLPAVGFSSDMGFQYGALCDIFYYGDGEQYPEYLHKFNVEASRYTGGSSTLNFFYDSKYLIKGLRTTVNVSYLPDSMMDFYGFNGYASPYFNDQNNAYYKVDRKYFRSSIDFQGKIAKNINWAAGVGLVSFNINPVQLADYTDSPSLYKEYLAEGIITAEESHGKHAQLKLGLVHDTRDHEADPKRGFCNELITISSKDVFQNRGNDYVRLALFHRGYLPVYGDRLTFAYRVGYQGTLAGEVPFYLLQDMATLYQRKTYSEGLGGYTSIRGVMRNRIVGNSFAFANFELRYRFCHFNFIGQEWHLALNPFFDMGQVITPYRADAIESSTNKMIYSGEQEGLHASTGLGYKIVMNQNFIISVEYGVALDPRDGKSSLSIGINYLF